jgi:hypothetical protein
MLLRDDTQFPSCLLRTLCSTCTAHSKHIFSKDGMNISTMQKLIILVARMRRNVVHVVKF